MTRSRAFALRLSRAGSLAAILLAPPGCAPERGALPEARAARPMESTPVAAAAPASPVAPAPRRGPDDAVQQMLARVSRARELEPTGPVRSQVLTREQMFEAVEQKLVADVPPAVATGTEVALYALGLVPAGFDYHQSVRLLLGTQLAGFYDPDVATMYLAGDLGPAEQRATLAHELVHALQDQHFELGAHIKYREGASDAQSAIHALAEGDATSAMLEQMLASRGMRATDLGDAEVGESITSSMQHAAGIDRVPAILKRSIIAPYVDGLALVHFARRRWGWARVDEFWRKLPESTEQVLHPEKLLARERPEDVAVPPSPSGGPASLIYQDVLGEQAVGLVLGEWLPEDQARAAARDWGGDRMAVYCSSERCAVVWVVRYDDRAAAKRGREGFAAGVVAAGGAVGSIAVAACVERPGRGPLAVVLGGREVAVVAGPYARAASDPAPGADCRSASRWAKRVVGGS